MTSYGPAGIAVIKNVLQYHIFHPFEAFKLELQQVIDTVLTIPHDHIAEVISDAIFEGSSGNHLSFTDFLERIALPAAVMHLIKEDAGITLEAAFSVMINSSEFGEVFHKDSEASEDAASSFVVLKAQQVFYQGSIPSLQVQLSFGRRFKIQTPTRKH